jgi:phosphoribosylanthranilate isomerase
VSKLFVKVCGMTRREDAALAAELGATALGFVFWPGSPRYISPEKARAIVEALPTAVVKVGVFVDEPVDQVVRIMDTVGLNAAQLHGQESPTYCRELTAQLTPDPTNRRDISGTSSAMTPAGFGFVRTLIKAVGMSDDGAISTVEFDPDVLILVDAQDPTRFGGTGRTVDWDVVRQIALSRPTILAGGLNPRNVALAVHTVRPYGVDVASGVEAAPGVKDHDQLKNFFEALND